MTARALLALVLLAARPASACRCDASVVKRLLARPERAATAALGKVEDSADGALFRVDRSWTAYTAAVRLGGGGKCALAATAGRNLIFLSARPVEDYGPGIFPTVCDSVLLEAGKAAATARRLAGTAGAGRASPNPSWAWCERDEDCVLAPGVCGGQDAIHRSYARPHEAWRARTAPAINCVAAETVPGLKAFCVDSLCAAR